MYLFPFAPCLFMAVAQVTLLMPRRQKTEKTARHDKTKALTAITYECQL